MPVKNVTALPPSVFEGLFSTPEFYLTEFAGRHAHFVRMSRDTYHKSIFTDRHRIVSADENLYSMEIQQLMEIYENRCSGRLPVNYIFHIAHCGSTLVSRAIDMPGVNLVYREPAPLRQLAADHSLAGKQIGLDTVWGRGLRMVCALLGRRYQAHQPVIVKANVPVNFILPELFKLNPDSRALFIYCRPQDFLIAALKSAERRQWVARLLKELAGSISLDTDIPVEVLHRLTPATGAACLWQVQVQRFMVMLNQLTHTRSLDCESFFNSPEKELKNILNYFCHETTDAEISQIVHSDLFVSHAKAPRIKYDNSSRKADRNNLLITLEDEINEGMSWLNEYSSDHKVVSSLPSPLA
jgi:hypothetical protein